MVTDVTPEEVMLASALDRVRHEEAQLEAWHRAGQEAQDRAAATDGLVAAAQRYFSNVEARYRVLLASAETADGEEKALNAGAEQLRADLVATRKELEQAEATQRAAQQCRAVLKNISKTVEDWSVRTEMPVSAAARNRAMRSVAELRAAVEELDAAAVDPLSLEALHTRLKGLKRKHADVRKALDTKRSETARAEIRGARADFDMAEGALREAPESERRAQSDLRLTKAALAEAERRHRTALQARDEAERSFIEDIDLSGPDAAGVIVARAMLRCELPKGYKLRWSAQAGDLKETVGKTVHLDTRGAPAGSYTLGVHLYRENGTE